MICGKHFAVVYLKNNVYSGILGILNFSFPTIINSHNIYFNAPVFHFHGLSPQIH